MPAGIAALHSCAVKLLWLQAFVHFGSIHRYNFNFDILTFDKSDSDKKTRSSRVARFFFTIPKYTKLPQKLQNYHKIYQIAVIFQTAIECTNFFSFLGPPKFTQIGNFGLKIWQPCSQKTAARKSIVIYLMAFRFGELTSSIARFGLFSKQKSQFG
jgi:hypothetical protein